MSTDDSPFVELPFDRAAERSVSRLRLFAAAGTAVASVFVLVQPAPVAARLCAAIGLLVSLMWTGMWMRARRRLANPTQPVLRLRADAIERVDSDGALAIEWRVVRAIEVDEDRLTLRVDREEGEPVHIEPCYGRLGVYELERAVVRAWRTAVPALTS